MPQSLFSQEALDALFPSDMADKFFDALYGSAEDGAYDIRLVCRAVSDSALSFAFALHQRPGKCLVCSLTYGLPQVFRRHPLLNVNGLAARLAAMAGWDASAVSWEIGKTEEVDSALHCVPLTIRRG